MLFNSYNFMFLFLPATIVIYFLLNRSRLTTAATAWLVLASLFFYGYWNIDYLALILGSILFNFGAGILMRKPGRPGKMILLFGITGNIALLVYYKYTNFFIQNINSLTGWQVGLQRIVLPLGISFFTFTQIAYLVDVYRNRAHEYDFLRYCLFVTFFPHLLAGPIIHHSEMMPQFSSIRKRVVNFENLSSGLYLFFIGLFKKVLIADKLAPVANYGFDTAGTLTLIDAWVTSLSYTLQLYFDFSAYTDMALGAALMFNIRLPLNFDSPYKAVSITDFWRRWHMTLSRFLRDYVYIPMGGNRCGQPAMYRNLMATFLIGGIWHGAGWTFVVWGFLHGCAAVVHRAWEKLGLSMSNMLGWFLTFNFVNIAWIFFRAKTWDDVSKVLSGMAGMNGIMLSPSAEKISLLAGSGVAFGPLFYRTVNKHAFYLIFACFLMLAVAPNSNELTRDFKPGWRTAFFTMIISTYAILNMNSISEFLYFNF